MDNRHPPLSTPSALVCWQRSPQSTWPTEAQSTTWLRATGITLIFLQVTFGTLLPHIMDGSEQPMLGESIPTPSLGNPALLGGFAALCSWVRAAECPAHTSRPGRTALRKGCWGKRQIPALLSCCWCSSPLPQPQRKGQEGK